MNEETYLGDLREHADMLLSAIPLVPPSHRGSLTAAADYLRACADALEKGPVAWRFKPMLGSPWSLSDDGYYISCKRDQGYIAEKLYPLAMPAPQPVSGADGLPPDRIEDPPLPQGYEPHELPADYDGPLFIESQMRAYARAAKGSLLRQSEPMDYAAGIEAVAAMIAAKAQSFAGQHGSDDMGSLSFGSGDHAEAKSDYYNSLVELAEEVRAMLAAVPTPPVAAENTSAGSVAETAEREHIALRLPEPMTDGEISDYARAMVKGGESVDSLIKKVERELVRRMKEANE